ncbi:alpha/beta fold hydrolase [Streptomyces sp. NPDC002817]|uniref:alpha/beta fold hydrolase n=1 Tax=Streptomyces sp. NPDC088357 TaxID=3154655 RepID=UPI00341DD641
MNELEPTTFAKELRAGFDVPSELAEEMVRHVDGPMKHSVLRLYRSALTMGADWEPALANLSAPALVFWGALDPACQVEFGEKLATAVRASRFLRLDCNHWPLLQMPTAVAAALELHWNQPE